MSIDINFTKFIWIKHNIFTTKVLNSELTIQDLGSENIVFYPDELGEIDVDRHIPLSRKNPNGLGGTNEQMTNPLLLNV